MKDKFKAKKEEMEESLANTLSYIFTTYSFSYKGLKRLVRVVVSYLDLMTDSILLSTVLTVIALTDNLEYTDFVFQVGMILTASIIVPLLLSAMMVASKRPLVILNSHQWKELTTSKDKKAVFIARLAILFLFPLVPAMIIFSNQTAEEELKSLKRRQETGQPVKEGKERTEVYIEESAQ